MILTALGLGLATGFAKSFLGLKGLGLASVVLGSSKAVSALTSVGIAGKAIGTLGTLGYGAGTLSLISHGSSFTSPSSSEVLIAQPRSLDLTSPEHDSRPLGSAETRDPSSSNSHDKTTSNMPMKPDNLKPKKQDALSGTLPPSGIDYTKLSQSNYIPPTPFMETLYHLEDNKYSNMFDLGNDMDSKVNYHYMKNAGLLFPFDYSKVDPSLTPFMPEREDDFTPGLYDQVKPLEEYLSGPIDGTKFKVSDLNKETAKSSKYPLHFYKRPYDYYLDDRYGEDEVFHGPLIDTYAPIRSLQEGQGIFPELRASMNSPTYKATILSTRSNDEIQEEDFLKMKDNKEIISTGLGPGEPRDMYCAQLRDNIDQLLKIINKMKKELKDIKDNPELKKHFERYFSDYVYNQEWTLHHQDHFDFGGYSPSLSPRDYFGSKADKTYHPFREIIPEDQYLPILNQEQEKLKELRKLVTPSSKSSDGKSNDIPALVGNRKPGEALEKVAMKYANDFLDHLHKEMGSSFRLFITKPQEDEIRKRVLAFWISYFNTRTVHLVLEGGQYEIQQSALAYQKAEERIFPDLDLTRNFQKGDGNVLNLNQSANMGAEMAKIIQEFKMSSSDYNAFMDKDLAKEKKYYQDFVKHVGCDGINMPDPSKKHVSSLSLDTSLWLEWKFFKYFGSEKKTNQVISQLKQNFENNLHQYEKRTESVVEFNRLSEIAAQIYFEVDVFKRELMFEYRFDRHSF